MSSSPWHPRRCGVLVPCNTELVAEYMKSTLLPLLLSNLSVQVIQHNGQYYVKQEVVYFTKEGAIPYDVSDVPEQAE